LEIRLKHLIKFILLFVGISLILSASFFEYIRYSSGKDGVKPDLSNYNIWLVFGFKLLPFLFIAISLNWFRIRNSLVYWTTVIVDALLSMIYLAVAISGLDTYFLFENGITFIAYCYAGCYGVISIIKSLRSINNVTEEGAL